MITITIHLPAALDDVNAVLAAVAERWPTSTVDTSHEDGWRVTLPSIDVGSSDSAGTVGF